MVRGACAELLCLRLKGHAHPGLALWLARFQKVQGRVCDPKSWGGLVSQGLPHSMEPAQAEIQLLGYPLLQLLQFPGAHTGF